MSKKLIIKTTKLEDLGYVAEVISKLCVDNQVFLLRAEMGLGKTTLVKEVAKQLGVTDLVNSPTYSIVNEYQIPSDKKIFHFDLYRLADENELYDIGFEDYINSDSIVFIEWPDIAEDFFPKQFVEIKITSDAIERTYKITHRTT